jgi:hypothetical protein
MNAEVTDADRAAAEDIARESMAGPTKGYSILWPPTQELIAQALATARAEGVKEGMEKAAGIVDRMAPGVPTGGGDYDEWSLDDVAENIRAAIPCPPD